MVLLPRMVRILMEGLIPVSEAARDFMAKRATGREIYIGLDSAVLVGHPANISAGLLLVPIAIVLLIILPGNHMLLFADLAVLVFLCTQFAPAAKGNVLRMIIVGTILLIIGFYISNAPGTHDHQGGDRGRVQGAGQRPESHVHLQHRRMASCGPRWPSSRWANTWAGSAWRSSRP